MTFDEILSKYRDESDNKVEQGTKFEQLMKRFLQVYPMYRGKFTDVWLWSEFPYRDQISEKDIGIDIVTRTVDGEFWAVQCKFFTEDVEIDKPAVDSFITTSGSSFNVDCVEKNFSLRLWIDTTIKGFGRNARAAVKNQNPPVIRIGLNDLQNADVDWKELYESTELNETVKIRELRDFQQEAVDAVHKHFKNHERGRLIMACGSGKTFTSLKIAENEVGEGGIILFLVPSIALLAQTFSDWNGYAQKPIDAICVCSDETVKTQIKRGRGSEDDPIIDVEIPVDVTKSTQEAILKISATLNRKSDYDGLKVVFSTYQSLNIVAEVQRRLNFEFNLIICDEAHRTAGYVKNAKADELDPLFTRIHDGGFIKAKHRLYMTATPRMFKVIDNSKKLATATDKDIAIWSMDDENIFGEEIYKFTFAQAIKKGVLSDYKIMIFTISEQEIPPKLQQAISDKNQEIDIDDAAKLIGCIRALSKLVSNESKYMIDEDLQQMKTAVAFCSKIKDSQYLTDLFNVHAKDYISSLDEDERNLSVNVEARHVDGTMSAGKRREQLSWLKNVSTDENNHNCHILTNARCLSEGIDVPTLDAVIFMSTRKSIIDVVQAVGRVMRRADGKKYGYIIIPVVIPTTSSPAEALSQNKKYEVIWEVINALRSHDERLDWLINKIKINHSAGGRILIEGGTRDKKPNDDRQIILNFEEVKNAILVKIVDKLTSSDYWQTWGNDVAKIAERHKNRISELISVEGPHQSEFNKFLKSLRQNMNPSVSRDEAIDMLAQHLITRPVFEALFENYSFMDRNAVSKSMDKIIKLLDEDGMQKELKKLDGFYNSVRGRCSNIESSEERQRIIIDLYDKFFRVALKKTVDKLGIVYTPIEVVDFILHSVNDVLKKEFNCTFSDKNVHILDPFSGTGTFISRLIDFIDDDNLQYKYQNELHANEIVLLAYYISCINIENAYHERKISEKYEPFEKICLTDTFQLGEDGKMDTLDDEIFAENSKQVKNQKNSQIQVIVGNPPYSVGQKSANDNAQNESYAHLENRIANTYVKNTNATNKNALYDSYIKAFRWASDRIESGVIGFVTNAGWLDGAAMDGLRKCFEDEFDKIYIFNLRGNARTQGEQRQKEAGNVFGSGSRAPIAITILVKNGAEKSNSAEIHYNQVDDYMSTRAKLDKLIEIKSILSEKFQSVLIKPNEKHDWINQRGEIFDKMIIIGNKKDKNVAEKVFCDHYGRGISTSRDAWCYNFSLEALQKNIQRTISYYNDCLNFILKSNPNAINLNFIIKNSDLYDYNSNYVNTDYDIANSDYNLVNSSPFTEEKIKLTDNFNEYLNKFNKFVDNLKSFIDSFIKQNTDSTKITWVFDTIQDLKRGIRYEFDETKIIECYYRPFIKSNLYYDDHLNQRTYQMPSLFPTGNEENLLICIAGIGVSKDFSVLITDKITDVQFQQNGQCFPLYYYEAPTEGDLFAQDKMIRHDGITDYIQNRAKRLYGDNVTKEDIFYYVYGFLHMPSYREKFANELKKSLPRLILVPETEKFWQISQAGRDLAEIHLNYETQEPPHDIIVEISKEDYSVQKMKLSKDKTTLIYNSFVTIKNLPPRAFEYVVNGRSPLEWIIDRYQVKIDKASQIENNPNLWCEEHGDPKYILNLILSCITVSLKTLEIVESLPEVEFE